MTGGEK